MDISRIRPLPEDVAAKVRSSAAITSLNYVALALVENALDANASQIRVTLDSRRGGCQVEDNGLGIPPPEFRHGGGLGRMHHTSKHRASGARGQSGTFLASVASLSLVTVTSHHHLHRSTNSITLHRSQVLRRDTPTHQPLPWRDQGTQVAVRDLFGNMPVRVKHRALAMDQRNGRDREWEGLKLGIAAYLLATARTVNVRLHEMGEGRSMVLSSNKTGSLIGDLPPSLRNMLRNTASIFGQLDEELAGMENRWIPASASSRAILIQGAISLVPSPTKRLQFISMGAVPASALHAHNELFDHINRLFKASTFGVEFDEVSHDLSPVGEYKNMALRNLRLARKGVDKWPMFYLRVSNEQENVDQPFSSDCPNLTNILEVLDALILGWLSAHHFRSGSAKQPDTPRPSSSHSTTPREAPRESTSGNGGICQSRRKFKEAINLPAESSTPTNGVKKRKMRTAPASASRETGSVKDFSNETASRQNQDSVVDTRLIKVNLSRGQRDPTAHLHDMVDHRPLQSQTPPTILPKDDVTEWTCPITAQTFHVNARTGNAIPAGALTATLGTSTMTSRLTLRPHLSKDRPNSARWIDKLLSDWQDPVFRSNESAIPRISLDVYPEEAGVSRGPNPGFTHLADMKRAFEESSPQQLLKLSKSSLATAKVISQVDRKFILVRTSSGDKTSPDTLVAIDQHAASERILLEELLADLCRPPTDVDSRASQGLRAGIESTRLPEPMKFQITKQEEIHFAQQSAHFADWGILFDISKTDANVKKQNEKATLNVHALPSPISERARIEPGLLINLLREELWRLVDDKLRSVCLVEHQSEFRAAASPSWLQRINSCPPGILSMLSSRACRSAVMFNDKIENSECEELVRRLADCAFPFQCAHGRPSLAPLVRLGTVDVLGDEIGAGEEVFATAWKRWRHLACS